MDVGDGTSEVKVTAVVGVVPFRRRFTFERWWLSTKYSTRMSSRTLVITYLLGRAGEDSWRNSTGFRSSSFSSVMAVMIWLSVLFNIRRPSLDTNVCI